MPEHIPGAPPFPYAWWRVHTRKEKRTFAARARAGGLGEDGPLELGLGRDGRPVHVW
jgi:hypothetical protein